MKTYRCKLVKLINEGSHYRAEVLMIDNHNALGGMAGERTITSKLKSIDFERRIIITQNSIYLYKEEY